VGVDNDRVNREEERKREEWDGWLVEYCFTPHQLTYGYVETDDDEIDRNADLHFKDKGSFTFPKTTFNFVCLALY